MRVEHPSLKPYQPIISATDVAIVNMRNNHATAIKNPPNFWRFILVLRSSPVDLMLWAIIKYEMSKMLWEFPETTLLNGILARGKKAPPDHFLPQQSKRAIWDVTIFAANQPINSRWSPWQSNRSFLPARSADYCRKCHPITFVEHGVTNGGKLAENRSWAGEKKIHEDLQKVPITDNQHAKVKVNDRLAETLTQLGTKTQRSVSYYSH